MAVAFVFSSSWPVAGVKHSRRFREPVGSVLARRPALSALLIAPVERVR
jgi:hypothetical protein